MGLEHNCLPSFQVFEDVLIQAQDLRGGYCIAANRRTLQRFCWQRDPEINDWFLHLRQDFGSIAPGARTVPANMADIRVW